MELLKKHYEKLILAVILLVLLSTGIWLAIKISRISAGMDGPVRAPSSRGELLPPLPVEPYAQALQTLQAPPQWEKGNVPLFPVAEVSAVSRPVVNTQELPFAVLDVRPQLFKLFFKSYTYDAEKGKGYNFQVNLQFRPRTFFVPEVGDAIKDAYEDTGYKVVGYTRKTREEYSEKTLSTNIVDESELIVQREGEEPVLLVLGRAAASREPVAKIQCDDSNQTQLVRRGQGFTCKGITYNVVDMSLTQMIVMEKETGRKHEINFHTGAAGATGTPGEGGLRPEREAAH